MAPFCIGEHPDNIQLVRVSSSDSIGNLIYIKNNLQELTS